MTVYGKTPFYFGLNTLGDVPSKPVNTCTNGTRWFPQERAITCLLCVCSLKTFVYELTRMLSWYTESASARSWMCSTETGIECPIQELQALTAVLCKFCCKFMNWNRQESPSLRWMFTAFIANIPIIWEDFTKCKQFFTLFPSPY